MKNGFKNILTKYKAANSNLSSRNECPKGLTKVPAEDFYKSINGLAYGTYAYVIKQFDKKANLLLETEYIEFYITKTRDFKRFCEEIKEKSGLLRIPIFEYY